MIRDNAATAVVQVELRDAPKVSCWTSIGDRKVTSIEIPAGGVTVMLEGDRQTVYELLDEVVDQLAPKAAHR